MTTAATQGIASGFPVEESTLPFWRTQLHELDSYRSTPDVPSECDLVVIGAGYAGVSTLYHLLESGNSSSAPPASKIVMLEAREACSGATGRNGGHIKPDVYYNILKYTQKYGAENAAAFARFEAANVLAVKELVERERIDCDFVLTRALDVYLDEAHAEATHAAYEELRRIGVADLADVQYLQGAEAEALSGVKGAKCTFSLTAAHLWPYKLVMHLLAKLVAKGINLQTHTPVTSVSPFSSSSSPSSSSLLSSSTHKWTVTTPRGIIHTHKILFATNGYTAALLPQFAQKIVPVRGICARIVGPTASPEKKKDPHVHMQQFLTHSYSLRHGPALYDYLIQRLHDHSVIVGGAKARFWQDRTHWYNVVDDSQLIGPAATYFDELMPRHFRGWECEDCPSPGTGTGTATQQQAQQVWTGIMGWSSDFMPYVGEVPGAEGQYILAGFSGHGMPLIYLASRAVADMLGGDDGDERERGKGKGQQRVFEERGVPEVFMPTRERLASEKNEILGI